MPCYFSKHAIDMSTWLITYQANLKDMWDEGWSDPATMTLISYRNINGNPINNCLVGRALKPIQDGTADGACRLDGIHYLSVNSNITFPDC